MASFNEKMSAIANALRTALGTTAPLTLDDIAMGISQLSADPQTQHWTQVQDSGNRTDYRYFGSYANYPDGTFAPKYDITVKNGYGMFEGRTAAEPTDLRSAQFKVKYGVDFDVANAINLQYWLTGSNITHVGTVSATRGWAYLFDSASKLVHITKLLATNAAYSDLNIDAFRGCTSLVEIDYEGTIKGRLSFADSPNLNKTSVNNTFSHLADLTAVGRTNTITLHPNVKGQLTETEIAIATQKGWTIV
jgi:hypothetical protein